MISGGGPRRSIPPRALSALLAVQLLFGVHYVAAKSVVAVIPPPAWATIRATLAAALLLSLEHLRPGKTVIPLADHARFALFALFGVVINQVLFTEGIARTTPAHSALMVTMIPVSTFLFAAILRRERVTRWKTAGLVTAFAGVLVLLKVEVFTFEDRLILGDLLTLLNACSFGFFLVISRRLARQYHPLTVTAWTMAWGAVGIGAYGMGDVLGLDPASIPPAVAWTGVWIVLFPTVLAYLLNFYALGRAESSTVALFIYLQPFIATLLSAMSGGALPGARYYVSALLVFAGVFLVVRGGAPPHAKILEAD